MATGEEAEKLKIITAPPFYVQKVMENGFKTTLGTLVISGLHVLPVWIYGNNHGVWTNFIPSIVNHLSRFAFWRSLISIGYGLIL